MADLIAMLAAAAGAAAGGGEVDPNFNQTVLLLHGDGTDGAQNNTFLDSSTNNFTVTRNGNTTQGTYSPFSAPDGRWSAYFPLASLTTPQRLQSSIDSAFGTGNFTVECFVYFIDADISGVFLDMRTGSGVALYMSIAENGEIAVQALGGSGLFIAASASTAVTKNAWSHVAVVRSGTGTNQVTLYIDGVSVATGTSADNFSTTAVTLCNRYTSSSPNTTQCYLSNFRISNVARTISVPTSPYISDANTLLLLCQSNRFVDNGANSETVTFPDATKPSITPFSPFAPTAAYDASVNGGSGYFDTSGDNLQLASPTSAISPGSGDFTFSCWIYPQSFSSPVSGILDIANGSNATRFGVILYANGEIYVDNNTNLLISANAVKLNEWTYISVVRSGSTMTIYYNGVSQASGTVAQNFSDTTTYIGRAFDNAAYLFNGYMADMRLVKGVALSASPPTAPLTAVSGTELLLNFTNAGIFDQTGKNNLETVGNAQIDTTTKKYGTGSMEFDGTGDELTALGGDFYSILSGDYTIEFWIYLNDSTSRGLMGCVTTGAKNGWSLEISATPKILFLVGDGSVITTTAASPTLSTSTWTHIACVKNGSAIDVYADGVAGTSATVSNITAGTGLLFIGDGFGVSSGDFAAKANSFNGFIDDLRITKGVARYTSAFTPPTKAFPNL
jgi:hypothetical protein